MCGTSTLCTSTTCSTHSYTVLQITDTTHEAQFRNFIFIIIYIFICVLCVHTVCAHDTVLQVKYVWIIFTGTCTGTGSLPGTVCTRVPV